MADQASTPVQHMITTFRDLLEIARERKPDNDIEPPLLTSDFGGAIQQLTVSDASPPDDHQARYAVIETAVRSIFYELLVSPAIIWKPFTMVNRTDWVSFARPRPPSKTLASSRFGISWILSPSWAMRVSLVAYGRPASAFDLTDPGRL